MIAPEKLTCNECNAPIASLMYGQRICQPCRNAEQRRNYAARQAKLDEYDDEESAYKPLPCEIEFHCRQFREGKV
jgi:hypothetical protein